jgi:hypothetical protein
MALIVEDGTGKADAESYIAVADATTYHANRGNTAWAGLASDTIREQHLRKAAEFMLQAYRLRWKGTRGSTTQALDWPRGLVERPDYTYAGLNGYTTISGDFYFPADEVPVEVQRACAELALRSIDGLLSADLERAVSRETVGPITVEYEKGALQTKRFEAVDNMLQPFLKPRGGFLPVTRI